MTSSGAMQKPTEYKLGSQPAGRTLCARGASRGTLACRTPCTTNAMPMHYQCMLPRESNPRDVACAEDSNVENIGSIMDKAARVAAAMTEECWTGVRNSLCLSSLSPFAFSRCSAAGAEVCGVMHLRLSISRRCR